MGTRQSNKHFSDLALWLFVVGAGMLLGCKAKPVVSGRAFLITVAGDVKPAIMAKVYLLYWGDANEYQNSVAHEWLEENQKATKAWAEEMKTDHYYSKSKSEICRRGLRNYSYAFSKTFDWVSANKKEWQLIVGQSDEEGSFRISVPHPGAYMLVVVGHAGFNDAVWISGDGTTIGPGTGSITITPNGYGIITINPGKETSVKMASPVYACVETSD
jgi:hypothetical protein